MPGEAFSLHAIAEVCGCSHNWIHKVERRALGKLLRGLRHSTGSLSESEERGLADEYSESVEAVIGEDAVDTFSTGIKRNGKTEPVAPTD